MPPRSAPAVSAKPVFEGDPEFINDEGVKWWRDEYVTHLAQRKDSRGTSLDAVCFAIERPDGYRTRVLVSRSRQIIEESQTLDGMATLIEVRKFLIRDHAENPSRPRRKQKKAA